MPVLSSKEILEKRGETAKQIKELNELVQTGGENGESRDFTSEEKEKWDKLNTAYDSYTRDAERMQVVERIAKDQEAPAPQPEGRQLPGRGNVSHKPESDDGKPESRDEGPTEEDRALALQAWFRAGVDDLELEPRHLLACKRVGIKPQAKSFKFKLRRDYHKVKQEFRALSINNPTAGGYTIPEGFIANLERALLEFGGMRSVADVMRTSSGEPMSWPTTDDTSNEGALINENVAVSEQDVTFGQITFYAHKYSSKLIRVPVELLEDSAFNLASEVGSMLGERLGRITNRHFTTGDGAGKPWGIVPRSFLGVTTAAATAITSDEIIDLIHSIDPSYRPGSTFMFHDGILQAIRKLKDGNGQYMWQPGLQSGVPDRIAGYPYVINQHMQSTVASATRTMIFGQLNKYKIRDVGGVRLIRLNERYADNDQVGFMAFSRHDGNLLNAGTNPVKHMLQA